MVDNIKIIKPLASVPSANRVKPARHKQKNGQQNLFKDTFMTKQKKKKGSMQKKDPGRVVTIGKTRYKRHITTNKQPARPSNKRIIDIKI